MLMEFLKGRVASWSWFVLLITIVTGGFYFHVEGAKNLSLFFLWFYSIVTVIMMILGFIVLMAADDTDKAWDELIKERAKDKYHVPVWIDFPTDFFILITIVWAGHWVLGTFWFIAFIGQNMYRHHAENYVFKKLKEGVT